MADKKQTELGRQGKAIVRVPLARTQTEMGRAGEPVVSVNFDTPVPVDNSAFGRGQRAGQVAKQSINKTAEAAMRSSLISDPLKTLAVGTLGSQGGRVAIRDFFDGLMGNPKGGPKTPVQPEPQQAVAQALQQGRTAAPTEIAPVDRQSQLIAAILGSGLTVNEAAQVAGILPAPANGGKAPSMKDNVLGQTAALSQELYKNQVAQIQAQAASGDLDTETARGAIEKATTEHFNRQAGLVGFDPLKIAQAALMDGALEDE